MLVLVQHFCFFNFSFILTFWSKLLFWQPLCTDFCSNLHWQNFLTRLTGSSFCTVNCTFKWGALGLFLCLSVCEKTLQKSLDLVIHPQTDDFQDSLPTQARRWNNLSNAKGSILICQGSTECHDNFSVPY